MYLTQSNVIRGLTKEEYDLLRKVCRYCNSLYNVALYNIRQTYFRNEGFQPYEENYHLCKTNENYKLVQATVSQQILKVADRDYKSFFALIDKAKKGEYDFKDISIPHYKEKGGLFNIILTAPHKNISKGMLTVPMSKKFKELYGSKKIKIKLPTNLKDKDIKEVRICPVYGGKYFKIEYCYEVKPEKQDVSKRKILAIDLGLDNLATCVTSIGTAFIMDGRKLKSINQHWNKRKAYYQRIASKQGIKGWTKRLYRITQKRNNRAKDYIRKTARFIINYCLDNGIGTVVCGYNKDFKRNINLGKKVNQQFTQISFGDFRDALKNLCERYKMQYIEQEESYTSKASSLDMDDIPVYDPEKPFKGSFSGKRIERGLYRFADGRTANADVNGAANILRKSGKRFNKKTLQQAILSSPKRIRVAWEYKSKQKLHMEQLCTGN